ncbi:hypothetical protein GUITHDRAFT_147773 [Guillardia theta CCMP2712]|uniref:Uncharacterized protein n=1 Tax=Guillardia theta (strain CCMP2712) TaxID=905079 RepID=L1IC18_GUITC|nr:hypothetical protein GUITHDRAFT_147773 [Guillardia theta CCMP2712]EKX33647.1 hypothetical protein GUITHDRAFT_147773 [Guillardia theta CCMP2712]|eukprot:XP_005820627.1 hypothetical protein GUITHDRAFT_147773 [Guillardia theta CCMP2712]
MTINSEWIKLWKEVARDAFSKGLPFSPTVAFIDGQIKLMKPSSINTWEGFLSCQFVSCVRRHFQSGCKTVVLAFDNYEHVPTCKGMTQHKRNRKVSSFSFASGDCLPTIIPQDWEGAIRNRLFKSRVIDYIKTKLPGYLTLQADQRLIIDHNEAPIEYFPNGTCRPFQLTHADLKGESDVKFTSYTHLGDMVIDAIDGDYVPMALVHIERLCRDGLSNASRVPQIAVYRIRVNARGDAPEKSASGRMEHEYVHINRLAQVLCRDVGPLTGGRTNACSVLALFTILTGCDYTQGLPTVGPVRVWANRRAIVPLLALIQGTEDSHDDDVSVISLASAVLYALVYEKRVSLRVNQSATREGVARELRREEEERIIRGVRSCGQMSAGTVAKLPDVNYLRSHASNALWTLHYWNAQDHHPDPYSKTFGYKRIKSGAAGWGVNRPRLER